MKTFKAYYFVHSFFNESLKTDAGINLRQLL